MLSREAIVSMRPPLHIAPNQTGFPLPRKQWLGRQWHISHSTHPERYSGYGSLSPVAMVSTGDEEPSRGNTADQEDDKITRIFAVSSSPDSPAVLSLNDKTTPREWEILAWGKEGQLESWMVEEAGGWISDTSGEVRADWRNSYVVVFISDTLEQSSNAVEIWERFGASRPLSDETVGKIRDALWQVARQDESKEFGKLVERLKPVSSE